MTWESVCAKKRRTAARPNHLAATAAARNYSFSVKASNLEPFYFGLRMSAIWESQTVHRPSLALSCSSWLDNPQDSSHHSSPESVEMFITWKLDYLMPKILVDNTQKLLWISVQNIVLRSCNAHKRGSDFQNANMLNKLFLQRTQAHLAFSGRTSWIWGRYITEILVKISLKGLKG